MRLVSGLLDGFERRGLVRGIGVYDGRADGDVTDCQAIHFFKSRAHTFDAGLTMHSFDGDIHTYILDATKLFSLRRKKQIGRR